MRGLKSVIITVALITAAFSFSYPQDKLKTAVIKFGNIDMTVEIAASPRAREKGLMHRKTLPEGSGMLFVYPKGVNVALWMKNTYIPLSAAFIREDGRIAQIVRMERINSTKIYKSKEKVKYALEVPLRWFEKNGIKSGDYCTIPQLVDIDAAF